MSEVRFRVVKTAGGWDGTITLPFATPQDLGPNAPAAKGITVTAKSQPTKQAAAKSAAAKALKVLENPLVQSVLPPQAALAVNVLKKVPLKKLKFW